MNILFHDILDGRLHRYGQPASLREALLTGEALRAGLPVVPAL
jgi:hypothetical protein